MPETRKKYAKEFREGGVRIVEETTKPIAQVARDLGVNEGTPGNWVPGHMPNGSSGLSTGDCHDVTGGLVDDVRRAQAVARRGRGGPGSCGTMDPSPHGAG